jgi:hypothetical protein
MTLSSPNKFEPIGTGKPEKQILKQFVSFISKQDGKDGTGYLNQVLFEAELKLNVGVSSYFDDLIARGKLDRAKEDLAWCIKEFSKRRELIDEGVAEYISLFLLDRIPTTVGRPREDTSPERDKALAVYILMRRRFHHSKVSATNGSAAFLGKSESTVKKLLKNVKANYEAAHDDWPTLVNDSTIGIFLALYLGEDAPSTRKFNEFRRSMGVLSS